jgi:hypothetical protein
MPAAAVHTPTQCGHFMLFYFRKLSTILKSSFVDALFIGVQKIRSSLTVVSSAYTCKLLSDEIPLQSLAPSIYIEKLLFLII